MKPREMRPAIGFVIDDEEAIADAVAEMLATSGYLTKSFYSPVAAIAALSHTTPDFVITDFSMPEMDGLTLALNVIQNNPKVIVIVISVNPAAMADHPHRHQFTVLQKPVSLSVMLKVLQREIGSVAGGRLAGSASVLGTDDVVTRFG
jgi:DNA-binding NtrC family response regulator